MRWLFHIARSAEVTWDAEGRYAPPSLRVEGFIHASYRDSVGESARLYFSSDDESSLSILAIDPRRLDAPVEIADTPRGPMPHIHGSIPRDAVQVLRLGDVARHDDAVRGTRIAFAAFDGMTLLDLVGPLDALSRISSMGFDPTTICEVVAMTRTQSDREGSSARQATAAEPWVVWSACGAELRASAYRPALEQFDVLVVPGGPGTRTLVHDQSAVAWLRTFPPNRLTASVCTGALLLGAAGRLTEKRATTHHTMIGDLERFGATPTRQRVVDEGQLVTAAGVTAGIDLGLHLVQRLAGDAARAAIAAQMEAR